MAWTAAFNATGPRGPGVLSGSGAPTSSIGATNDLYLDTATGGGPYLYGPKTSSGWPTSSISLLGATGAPGPQILFGTTQPGPPTFGGLNVGDFFLRTDTFNFYQLQRVSGSVSLVLVGNFQGGVGPAGLSVLSGSGAPASSLGVSGQPAYIDTTGGYLYGAKTSSGWPTSPINLNGVMGAAGASVRTGSGAPASGLGNVNDVYFDTTSAGAPIFYGAKTSSGWPSTGVSLLGAQGTSTRVGSGAPASSLGNVGDVYFDTTSAGAPIFYSAKTSSGWPASGVSLVGQTGSAGLSVLTGSGAPASSLGVQGQPYIDTTTPTLYVRGASAWNSGVTLVGIQGIQGLTGASGLSVLSGSGAPASSLGVQNQPAYLDTAGGILYGAKGASAWPASGISLNGLSIRNGSGAPTSSKPTVQFDGDFYVDTSANVIYGPRASGSWPASGVSFAGNTIRTGSGAPASSLGATGDLYIDGSSGLIYSKASGSWATTGGNLTGPQGVVGPQGYTSLTNQAACAGNIAYSTGATLSTTAQAMLTAPGLPAYAPTYISSALVGVTAVNNGPATTVTLYDVTAAKALWTANIAASSNYTSGVLSSTTYLIDSTHTYQWQVTGSSGTSNIQLNPYYLQPSMQSTVGSGFLTGFTSPSGTTLSSTVQYLGPGSKIGTSTSACRQYVPIRTGLLFGVQALYIPNATTDASATASFTLYAYNQSGGSTTSVVSFSTTNNGVPKSTSFASPYTLSTATTYFIGVTGTATGLVDVTLIGSV